MELAQHPPMNAWIGKVELVDGRIVRKPPPGTPHWNTQRLIMLQLIDIFRAVGPEWIVGTEGAVRLSTGTVRVADVVVLRAPDLRRRGALDRAELFLAVEIADTTLRNDLGPKLRDYAEARVPHYWVADLKTRETHLMSAPEGRAYLEHATIPFGAPIPVPGAGATTILS